MTYVNNELIAHVHTDLNMCMLLLYIKKFNPKKVHVIYEERCHIIDKIFLDKLPCDLTSEKASGTLKKIFKFFKFFLEKRNNVRFIKFTNYSYFGQCLQKALKPVKIEFIDEGTTFINIKNDKLRYESGIKNILKKLLWPSPFKPRFDCFVGVDKAYMTYSQLLKLDFDLNYTKLRDIFQIFDYNELAKISEDWLDVKDEICKWKEQFQSNDRALVIGSPYVRVNALSINEYLELISKLDHFDNLKFIYKAHPGENIGDYSFKSSIENSGIFKLPLELLFAAKFPPVILSFGSTSAFLSHNQADSKTFHILPCKVFDQKICTLLSSPPLNLNIRRV